MKPVLRISIAVLALVLTVPASAQQPQEQQMPPEMEAWMKAATPGPNHQLMASWAGDWSYVSRMWMDPSAPPQESKGRASSELILGGRYLLDHFSGEMMGMPFDGMGLTGYDNINGKFVSVWADSMSTGILVSEGSYDAGARTMTMTAEYTDPMTKKVKKMRMVTKYESRDRHVMEFYDRGPDGKEFKSMELIYTRITS